MSVSEITPASLDVMAAARTVSLLWSPGEMTCKPFAHSFSKFPRDRISTSSPHTEGVVNISPATGHSEKKMLESRTERISGAFGVQKMNRHACTPQGLLMALAIRSAADILLHARSIVSLQITSRMPVAMSLTYAPPVRTPWTHAA